VGNALTIPQPEIAEARRLYLERYANSKYWVDFEDFSFYRMDVVDVYYVGGFGVMGWVKASDYDQAQPDPLADVASGIIEHMNADHKDALILLARTSAGVESQEAAMTAVDRLGFNVRLKTTEGVRGVRIAFLRKCGMRWNPEKFWWKWCSKRVSSPESWWSGKIFFKKKCPKSFRITGTFVSASRAVLLRQPERSPPASP